MGLLVFGFAFAWGTTTSTVIKIANPSIMPPISSNSVTYAFNETWVKTLINQKNILLQVNCNSPAILQSLGFGFSTKKLFTLWLEEAWYEYTFDLRNCSLRWNKVNANYSYNKSLTETEALALADRFMKTSFIKDKVFNQLGKPFVIYKNSNGPYYPIKKEGIWYRADTVLTGIEIDDSDEEDVAPEYVSFSIMYPYVINGQEVWEQYGNRAGIQLEVTADGVMSLNARLLPFKWAKRNSEKLSGDDAVNILKNWGNSPFYGQSPITINFAAPQKVLVLFTMQKDNKNYLYMSSGIWLKSDVKQDRWAQQSYTMILSDYRIGNIVQ